MGRLQGARMGLMVMLMLGLAFEAYAVDYDKSAPRTQDPFSGSPGGAYTVSLEEPVPQLEQAKTPSTPHKAHTQGLEGGQNAFGTLDMDPPTFGNSLESSPAVTSEFDS